MNRKPLKPAAPKASGPEAQARKQRLADALRQNLRRRKKQSHERAGKGDDSDRGGSFTDGSRAR